MDQRVKQVECGQGRRLSDKVEEHRQSTAAVCQSDNTILASIRNLAHEYGLTDLCKCDKETAA